MAVIAALEALKKPCDVMVYCDSRYVVNAMQGGWARRWREQGWVRSGGQRVPNVDLWDRLLNLSARHRPGFQWLPGHGASEENQLCDRLARDAARQPDLPADRPFEAKQRRKYAARSRLRGKRS